MSKTSSDISEAVLYGGTGQAIVVRPILEARGIKLVAVFDDTPDLAPPFPDIPIFRGRDEIEAWLTEQKDRLTGLGFCITIGNPHGAVRCRLHDELTGLGMQPLTVVHASAVIEDSASIGEGCQVMAGAIVGAQARLGRQCIVNTGASVDHECVLEEGVEIAPGATLCGLITIGRFGWVCAGATVLPRVSIGENAVVGAGSLVREEVPTGKTVVGVPARTISKS